MIEYPSQLPLPLREGYGLQHVEPMQRTQLASGRARQRRRFTSVPSDVSVSWIMSQPEARLFEAWYRDVISDGAAWFQCPLKTPLGIQHYKARFTGIYRGPELVGLNHWRFTAELELIERPLLERGWGEFPEFVVGSSIIDQAVNQQWPLSRYQMYMDAFDYAINDRHP